MVPLLEKLFNEIKHGDQEHQNWLRDKMETFSLENPQVDKCEELREGIRDTIRAWEAIPGNQHHTIKVVQKWLVDDMKPSIDNLRNLIK